MAPGTKKIPLCLLATNGLNTTNGFLSMTRAKYKKGSMNKAEYRWRAVLRVVGEAKREYGTMDKDPIVTARHLLERMAVRITTVEKDRVLAIVQDLCGTRSHDSRHRQGPSVAFIHQIYGVFRDGRSMPNLFENSQTRWRQVAKQVGAKYHMWSVDEVYALMNQDFPSVLGHI